MVEYVLDPRDGVPSRAGQPRSAIVVGMCADLYGQDAAPDSHLRPYAHSEAQLAVFPTGGDQSLRIGDGATWLRDAVPYDKGGAPGTWH